MTIKKLLMTSQPAQVVGQALLTSTQDWVVPAGVVSISLVAFDPGKPGSTGAVGNFAAGGAGGDGGTCRYLNSVTVTPGQVFPVTINSTDTIFGAILSGKSGGVAGASATRGVTGGSGAGNGELGGAGGAGGKAAAITNPSMNAPGSPNGSAGPGVLRGGRGGDGAFPGGGGGGGGGGGTPGAGGNAGAGAIYVIWSGRDRQFPMTRTAYEIDGEVAWQIQTPIESSSPPTAIATNGAGIWCVAPYTANNFYFRSTDNGKTFTKITRSTTRDVTGMVFLSGLFIASTTNNVVMRSSDLGLTWTELSAQSSYFISASPTGRIFVGNVNGIYYSDNLGTSWSQASAPGLSGALYDMSFGESQGILVGDGNALRTVNNGLSWTTIAQTLYRTVAWLGGYFLATKSNSNAIGRTSSSATTSFTDQAGPASANVAISAAASRLFLGTTAGLFQSKDNLPTWSVPPTISNLVSGDAISIGKVVGDGFGVVIAAGNNGLIIRGEFK